MAGPSPAKARFGVMRIPTGAPRPSIQQLCGLPAVVVAIEFRLEAEPVVQGAARQVARLDLQTDTARALIAPPRREAGDDSPGEPLTPPTWIGAASNMRRRMEANCTNENSMPMVKRSRTIPISANTWTVPMSEMRFNPWGPMSAPATKNPAIEGSRNLWNTKTTAIDTVKITSRFASTP